jgi:hypothetical protein
LCHPISDAGALPRRAEQIHERLVRVYAEDAFVHSTVYKWMREFRSGRKAVEDLPRVGRTCLDDIDGAILQKLNKYPFHSCRSLAEDVGVAPSTIWKHLTEIRHFSASISVLIRTGSSSREPIQAESRG